MNDRTVLISGASVAGPALAYWLRRYGFTPTVVERAPAPRPGGQAIDLRGAARDVAERMGLLPEIRRVHTGVRGMAYVDGSGRIRATMPAELLGHSGGAVAEIELLRSDLVRMLYDSTQDDAEYVFDDSVTAIAQDERGVDVTFHNGAPRRFDLVIGADGLHSRVRSLAFGAEPEFVRDLGYHLAIFSATTERDLDGWFSMYSMPGGKMAAVYPLPDGARAMFYFAGPPVPRPDTARQKEILAEVFADGGWEVPRLLDIMRTAPDLYFDRASRVDMPSWRRGRVALVGDSAFAGSVGMGTSMALVGAYVLAGELSTSDDHVTGFARYESEMRAYVARCQQPIPGGLKGFLPPTRSRIWVRNQVVRALPHLPGKHAIAGDIGKAAESITLKRYPVGTPTT